MPVSFEDGTYDYETKTDSVNSFQFNNCDVVINITNNDLVPNGTTGGNNG